MTLVRVVVGKMNRGLNDKDDNWMVISMNASIMGMEWSWYKKGTVMADSGMV
jgi:hypothetical protein